MCVSDDDHSSTTGSSSMLSDSDLEGTPQAESSSAYLEDSSTMTAKQEDSSTVTDQLGAADLIVKKNSCYRCIVWSYTVSV